MSLNFSQSVAAFKKKFKDNIHKNLPASDYQELMELVFQEMDQNKIEKLDEKSEEFFRQLFQREVVQAPPFPGNAIPVYVLMPSIGSNLLLFGVPNKARIEKKHLRHYVLMVSYNETQTERYRKFSELEGVMKCSPYGKPDNKTIFYDLVKTFGDSVFENYNNFFEKIVDAVVELHQKEFKQSIHNLPDNVENWKKDKHWAHLKNAIDPFESEFNCAHFFLYALINSGRDKFKSLKEKHNKEIRHVDTIDQIDEFWNFCKKNKFHEMIIDCAEQLYDRDQLGLVFNRNSIDEGLFGVMMHLSAWKIFEDVLGDKLIAQCARIFNYYCMEKEEVLSFDNPIVINEMVKVFQSGSKLWGWTVAVDCASGRIGEGALRVAQYAHQLFNIVDEDSLICALDTVCPIHCEWNFEKALIHEKYNRLGTYTFGSSQYRIVMTPVMQQYSDFNAVLKEPIESATVKLLNRRFSTGGDLVENDRDYYNYFRYMFYCRRSNVAESNRTKDGRRNEFYNRYSGVTASICALLDELENLTAEQIHQKTDALASAHDPYLEKVNADCFHIKFPGITNPDRITKRFVPPVEELAKEFAALGVKSPQEAATSGAVASATVSTVATVVAPKVKSVVQKPIDNSFATCNMASHVENKLSFRNVKHDKLQQDDDNEDDVVSHEKTPKSNNNNNNNDDDDDAEEVDAEKDDDNETRAINADNRHSDANQLSSSSVQPETTAKQEVSKKRPLPQDEKESEEARDEESKKRRQDINVGQISVTKEAREIFNRKIRKYSNIKYAWLKAGTKGKKVEFLVHRIGSDCIHDATLDGYNKDNLNEKDHEETKLQIPNRYCFNSFEDLMALRERFKEGERVTFLKLLAMTPEQVWGSKDVTDDRKKVHNENKKKFFDEDIAAMWHVLERGPNVFLVHIKVNEHEKVWNPDEFEWLAHGFALFDDKSLHKIAKTLPTPERTYPWKTGIEALELIEAEQQKETLAFSKKKKISDCKRVNGKLIVE